MANFRDLLRQVRAAIPRTTPEEVHARLAKGEQPVVLDVREDDEVRHGVVPGAVHVARPHFESRIEDKIPDKDAEVIVYCATGVRSSFAIRTMAELGYTNLVLMDGGFTRWKDLGFHFSVPAILGASQRDRYSRHILLPDVGEAGQLKLLESKVLCIGAGGLGSPALFYLAAAGVGTLGIVDSDVVEENNLQRQVIHNTDRLGMLKADSAKETITKLNPDVNVVVHPFRIDASNARELMSQYDVVLDGTDNFDTRYVINDASVALGMPVVHGSIFRFEGMMSTFVPGDGPCYRCLYPEAPPAELAPT